MFLPCRFLPNIKVTGYRNSYLKFLREYRLKRSGKVLEEKSHALQKTEFLHIAIEQLLCITQDMISIFRSLA